ncbi:family 20 glycosylhydrolase [Actinomyces vulturis]|uniref:family 20 glycosylhydrolase n=1 Tax=Actinomyces vulturis TaxID=1857645 RepID=UPI0008355447|nr:family 20 glycosylhydrolase [Actinomyces vulturis]
MSALATPVDFSPLSSEHDSQPAHHWRGLLIDSSRTFWPVPTMKLVLDLMARYRLNRLHWHLTDNSGWRIEVPEYPRLTSVGAQLPRKDFEGYDVPAPMLARYQERAPFLNNSGFYSNEDIREIVDYATNLGIEIMPEVDLPCHMEAAIIAYPELGCPEIADVPLEQRPVYRGRHQENNLLWPVDDAFDLIDAALASVASLFPFPVVHVGGDECDFEYWENSPSAQAWMREHGVSSGPELQGVFMDHARKTLARYGKSVALWDEAVATTDHDRDLIIGWRPEGKGTSAARNSGNPWIYADSDYLYFNKLASLDTDEQVAMNGVITPYDVLTVPIPHSSTLQGVQCSVWCEFATSHEELMYQLLPRLIAAAIRGWCGDDLSVPQCQEFIASEQEALTAAGLGYAFLKPVDRNQA